MALKNDYKTGDPFSAEAVNAMATVINTNSTKVVEHDTDVHNMEDSIQQIQSDIHDQGVDVYELKNQVVPTLTDRISNVETNKANKTDLDAVDLKAKAAGQLAGSALDRADAAKTAATNAQSTANDAMSGLGAKADSSTVTALDGRVANVEANKADNSTVTELSGRVTAVETNKIDRSQIGVAGGVAPLTGDGRVPAQYIAYMLNGVETLSNTSTHSEIVAVVKNPELLADAVIQRQQIKNISTNDPLYNNASAISSNVDNPVNVRYINLYFIVGFDPEYLGVQFDISNLNDLKVEIQSK